MICIYIVLGFFGVFWGFCIVYKYNIKKPLNAPAKNFKKKICSHTKKIISIFTALCFKPENRDFFGKFIMPDLKSGHFQNVHFSKPLQ